MNEPTTAIKTTTPKEDLLEAIDAMPGEDLAKATVKLFIHMPTGENEVITNPNILAKGAYIERAYDDKLHLKACNDIYITNYEVRVDYRKGVSFGDAVKYLKEGYTARRIGWNGKGMFLYYVSDGAYPAKMECIKGVFENDMVPYGAYIAMKTAQGNVVPWLASQTDVLSEDWEIVEFPHPIA